MPHSIVDEAVTTEAVDAAALVAENAALRDRLLRALADAENARRRAERSAEEVRKYAIADFARELLIVVDNLYRTIAAAEVPRAPWTEGAALVEGARATLRLLLRILESFGVRPVAAVGQRFDPKLHEAIMEVDDPTQPPGTVTSVVEDGYTINGRLLRPARVAITRRPPAGSISAPADEQIDSAPSADRNF